MTIVKHRRSSMTQEPDSQTAVDTHGPDPNKEGPLIRRTDKLITGVASGLFLLCFHNL